MNQTTNFPYKPGEHEAEKASNSYLMSLVAVVAGLPFPIVNLIASVIFYLSNRKGTYFVRWHATQSMLSQLGLVFFNSISFWWTISIVFGDENVSNRYFAYLFTVIILNLFEFISTIYAAIETRKGRHVDFWFFGSLTDLICKP
ncbi:hypothetical protein FNO01nite_08780 [Flavobacterium noncentrifugens]|uniref:DUF4870 domain-containing protein n=1 Tax=Flavobacterium noncentrifugens TaxID=1128970 RepID=A0A1G8TF88_9FLAO|nr:DUF4870 domain-containing protein [Flavobacterium noncentrifugens]GEP50206.1 hypothetical protein FNO01nite_08780 [Flavobacterium noncentrifugens]SDJ40252.1 protein of unknown function [Flavobacterium noncentrifugens]